MVVKTSQFPWTIKGNSSISNCSAVWLNTCWESLLPGVSKLHPLACIKELLNDKSCSSLHRRRKALIIITHPRFSWMINGPSVDIKRFSMFSEFGWCLPRSAFTWGIEWIERFVINPAWLEAFCSIFILAEFLKNVNKNMLSSQKHTNYFNRNDEECIKFIIIVHSMSVSQYMKSIWRW